MTSHLKRGQKPHVARLPPSDGTASADDPAPDFDFLLGGDLETALDASRWHDFFDEFA
jgi:hypothetical protein